MCCKSRSVLPGINSASWNSSKSVYKHMFMCFSICNCFLMGLIWRIGHLILGAEVQRVLIISTRQIHLGPFLFSLWIKSPIVPHMQPMSSHHLRLTARHIGWWMGGVVLQLLWHHWKIRMKCRCNMCPPPDHPRHTHVTCCWNIHDQP